MSDVELKVVILLPEDAAMAEEHILCVPVEGDPDQAIVDTVPVLAHGVTFRDRIALTTDKQG